MRSAPRRVSRSVALVITRLLRGSNALSSRNERENSRHPAILLSEVLFSKYSRTRRVSCASPDTFVVSSRGTLLHSPSLPLPLRDVLHYRTLNGRFPRQWAPLATSFEISFVPSDHNDSLATRGPDAKETRPLLLEYTQRPLLPPPSPCILTSSASPRGNCTVVVPYIGPPSNWDTHEGAQAGYRLDRGAQLQMTIKRSRAPVPIK